MKVSILKSFPYAHDGIQLEMLNAGEVGREVRDELVKGLAAAGLVGLPTGETEDLSKLTVPQLLELAAERRVDLGDATKKADIIAALELAAEVL